MDERMFDEFDLAEWELSWEQELVVILLEQHPSLRPVAA